MKVLFIGDIVGQPGRKAIECLLSKIISEMEVDFTIANAENAAGGFGLTKKVVLELLSSGIDVLTTGNHLWDKKEIVRFIKKEKRLLRPANYPDSVPGCGCVLVKIGEENKIGILNVSGRVFMESLDCPFRTARHEIERLRQETNIIVVDVHAEATSEKIAMGWFLDGSVSAVLGTHTHVQTADEKILPGGTAYITDVGMTGAFDSVIGMSKEIALERFLTQVPVKFKVAEKDIYLHGIIVEIDDANGKSTDIMRIQQRLC